MQLTPDELLAALVQQTLRDYIVVHYDPSQLLFHGSVHGFVLLYELYGLLEGCYGKL